jgi:hypothetical protein
MPVCVFSTDTCACVFACVTRFYCVLKFAVPHLTNFSSTLEFSFMLFFWDFIVLLNAIFFSEINAVLHNNYKEF